MLEDLLNNYYFQNFLYIVFFISISYGVIKSMSKRGISVKDKYSFKNIDYKYVIEIISFSFFIRILLEQIQNYFNITHTDTTMSLTFLSIFVYFVVRCLVAPIVEELIFRFGLYEFLIKKMNYMVAIVICSVLFSVLHGYVLYDTFILFVLSIIWCYSYYKKENLIYPIVLHCIHNIYALISYANIDNTYNIIFGVACIIIWLYLYIKRK